jgi:hypothetical protein
MVRFFLGSLDGAASERVGRHREGAKERAMGHSAAATAPAFAALIALTHDTLSPSAFAQVNGYTSSGDAMRIYPKIPCLEKRPVRFERATWQLRRPTSHR